jgi:hypothetical protein
MSGPLILPHFWLLSLYAIIPISLILIAVDSVFLHSVIQSSLPNDPQSYVWFNVFFVMPHIVASSFSFFDEEYMHYYKSRLLLPIVIISLGTILLPSLVSEDLFQLIYAAWTVVHVVGQQFGIALLTIQRKSTLYVTWKWAGIALSLCIYLCMFFPPYGDIDWRNYIKWYGGPLFVVFAIVSFMLYRSGSQRPSPSTYLAAWYICSNFALVLSCWILLILDYPFLTIFIPRAIHDISAFMVYMNHDHNRNSRQTRNLLYYPLSLFGIPPIAQTPLWAIVIGYLCTFVLNRKSWGQKLVMIVTFLHYYTDSFAWQRDSPHRKFVLVK